MVPAFHFHLLIDISMLHRITASIEIFCYFSYGSIFTGISLQEIIIVQFQCPWVCCDVRPIFFFILGAFCAAALLGWENTIVQICSPSHRALPLGSLGSKF